MACCCAGDESGSESSSGVEHTCGPCWTDPGDLAPRDLILRINRWDNVDNGCDSIVGTDIALTWRDLGDVPYGFDLWDIDPGTGIDLPCGKTLVAQLHCDNGDFSLDVSLCDTPQALETRCSAGSITYASGLDSGPADTCDPFYISETGANTLYDTGSDNFDFEVSEA